MKAKEPESDPIHEEKLFVIKVKALVDCLFLKQGGSPPKRSHMPLEHLLRHLLLNAIVVLVNQDAGHVERARNFINVIQV